MFASASTSKVVLPSSRSRQESVQSQVSDMAIDEEGDHSIMSNNTTSSGGTKRKANRSNPQVSYAYGAPSDGKQIVKKPRTSKDISADVGSPPLAQSPSPRKVDAATRYKAVRERHQRRQTTPLNGQTGNTESPRRSARLSTAGSQDGAPVPLQERQMAIAAIEEDQAVEEEEEDEEEEKASSMASQQRRQRMMSEGQSRNTHLSSFYLDENRGNSNGNGAEGINGIPTSLLRGAQRPRHEDFSQDMGSASIRSSDIGDSRSHDYAEEERIAEMYEQRRKEASKQSTQTSNWSPTAWLFKSKVAEKKDDEGKGGEEVGETSLDKRRRKARVSEDNRLYRPEGEGQSDVSTDDSMEGRKHSHRKRKGDTKGAARGGRADKKIWGGPGPRRGGKGRSLGGEDTTNGEEEKEQQQCSGEEAGKQESNDQPAHATSALERVMPLKPRNSNVNKKPGHSSGGVSFWAMVLAGLLLLTTLLNMRARQTVTGYKSFSGLTPSGLAPKSLSEASERILYLESAFGALKEYSDKAVKEEVRLASRLGRLETESGKASQLVEAESKRIQSELVKLQIRLEAMRASSHASDVASSTTLRNRLDALEERMKSAERGAAATKQSLEWLEKKLPAEVAVPVHPATGQPSLDAATWEELRKIFIGRDDQAFQRRNQEAIRAITLETVDDKVRSGVVLDRETFVNLLEKELSKVKVDMEQRFNANAGEMQNDILAKVRGQQDMFETSGSWKKTATQDLSQVNIPTKNGSDARQAIMELIQSALELYSQGGIAKKDFALYTSGGRVIPSMTSPTIKIQHRRFFGLLKGRSEEVARPPVIALHQDTAPGMCWPFPGDQGQLGILLARKVIVSDITLEHIATSVSLEDGTTAPRDVEIWAMVERNVDREKLIAYRHAKEQEQQHDISSSSSVDAPASAPPSKYHILLASFTYDIHSPRTKQTFSVPEEIHQLQIPSAIIQVKVTSNHGNKNFTCLYRVRIHGQEWQPEQSQ